MLKVYTIKANYAELKFKFGKGTVRAVFKGGCMNSESAKPAECSTSNPLVQAAIEQDPRFGYLIRLSRSFPENEDEKAVEGKAANGNDDNGCGKAESENAGGGYTIVEEVTDINGMRDYLKSIGVPHQALYNKESIVMKAEERRVKFPNVQI